MLTKLEYGLIGAILLVGGLTVYYITQTPEIPPKPTETDLLTAAKEITNSRGVGIAVGSYNYWVVAKESARAGCSDKSIFPLKHQRHEIDKVDWDNPVLNKTVCPDGQGARSNLQDRRFNAYASGWQAAV